MKIVRAALIATTLLPILLSTAEAQKFFTSYLTGQGTASESDRGQALSEATEQAQNNASSPCVGNVVNLSTISSSCSPIGLGDNVTYVCMVVVRATCQYQTNPK